LRDARREETIERGGPMAFSSAKYVPVEKPRLTCLGWIFVLFVLAASAVGAVYMMLKN